MTTSRMTRQAERASSLTRRKMLKLSAAAIGGAAVAPVLSACGSSLGAAQHGGGGGGGAPSAGGNQLSLLLDHTSIEVQRFQKVVDKFQKSSKLKVSVGNIATGSAFYTKINTEGVAKTLPDVWYARTFDVAYDAIKQWAEPLDSYISKDSNFNLDDFWPALKAQAEYHGHVYTLPWNLSDYVVFVNESVLEKAGLSLPSANWTWADFEAAAAKVPVAKRSNGRQSNYGASVTGLVGDWGLRGVLAAEGSELLSPNFEKSIAYSEPNVRFFMFLANLANKHLVPTASSFPATVDPFVGGLVAYSVGGSWNIAEYTSEIGSKFKWSILPIPKGSTGKRGVAVAGGGFAVSAFSKNKQAAFELANALTNTSALNSVVSQYLDSLPARQSAMPDFLKTAKTGKDAPKGINNIQLETSQALTVNYPPYEVPYQTVITNRTATLLNGNVTEAKVRTMLKQIDSDTRALISQYFKK